MSQSSTWAVITGDIVGSRQLEPSLFEDVMAALAATASGLAKTRPDARIVYERYRGDGWQLALSEPQLALRAALLMRAAVRSRAAKAETRLAVGLGTARLADDLAAAGGTAFERSGQALEALDGQRLWGYGGRSDVVGRDAWLAAVIILLDERSQAWSSRQAEIAAGLLVPEADSIATLAEALGLTRQTVQEHFTRAGGYALRDALAAVETTI